VTVPTFGTELAAMIGIGVGIDYALFIVTTYRQRLHEGDEPRAATMRAAATSGRAVLFAGCTVVISLLGMLLLGASFVYGLAFGAIAAVVLVMAAALTLLPAVLGFTGGRSTVCTSRRCCTAARPTVARPSGTDGVASIQRRPVLTGSVARRGPHRPRGAAVSMHLAFTDQGNDATSLTPAGPTTCSPRGSGPA